MLNLLPLPEASPVNTGHTYYLEDFSGQSKIALVGTNEDGSYRAKIVEATGGIGFRGQGKNSYVLAVTRDMLRVSP